MRNLARRGLLNSCWIIAMTKLSLTLSAASKRCGHARKPQPLRHREVVARFPDGGAEEVNAAVEAARKAFPGWSGASPEVRSDLSTRSAI